MNVRVIALGTLCAVSSCAIVAGDKPPDIRQWHTTLKSLFDLVHSGYHITAISNFPGMKPDSESYTYILEKDSDVYKCLELHSSDNIAPRGAKERLVPSQFYSCFHLVPLYVYDPKTDRPEP